ncbi:phosphate ABC transporter substrate-binding protein [Atlanticothrix silvestris]|uniref:phosphate ABC transporter substrate-binding protein n=1 Tax=Atlanticothrix silvestris TaxID=2840444 RepID=UPI00298ED841|nr:phosphate ABC transporter substrate-binding protein [Atlanticothrix silvestris]
MGVSKFLLQVIAAGISSTVALTTITGSYLFWQAQLKPEATEKNLLAQVSEVPRGIFRYGGSTSFAPLRNPEIIEQIHKYHPGYELVYTEPPLGNMPGSGIGIKMLIDGQLSFSQSSRPVKQEEYKTAKERNFQLEQIPVAIDGIAIYVNPKLDIPGVTVTQIRDIFTGKITNWKQVGGPNLAITPISRDPHDEGTPEFFQETVLEGTAFAASAQPYVRDTTNGIRKVANTLGGIGYATASEVCNQSLIKSLPTGKNINQDLVSPCNAKEVNKAVFAKNIYPITRRLFVVIKRDGKLDEKAGVAYANMLLSDEGQHIVNHVGLVPLYDLSYSSPNMQD